MYLFIFLEPPTSNGASGGGAGIKFEYKRVIDSDYVEVFYDDDKSPSINLHEGEDYIFRCTVVGVHPVADLGAAMGSCPTGSSTIERDVVDIFFTLDTSHPSNPTDYDGMDTGADEPATLVDGLYDITDTLDYTVSDSHHCPTTISCRAVYDVTGNSIVDDPAATPFFTVKITRISKYIIQFYLCAL